MSEPTIDDVRAAVAALPERDRNELANGPIHDPDDPDACRICELYEDYAYGFGLPVPHEAAILTLIDYHRFYANDGRGEKAFARCLEIYEFAGYKAVAAAVRDLASEDPASFVEMDEILKRHGLHLEYDERDLLQLCAEEDE